MMNHVLKRLPFCLHAKCDIYKKPEKIIETIDEMLVSFSSSLVSFSKANVSRLTIFYCVKKDTCFRRDSFGQILDKKMTINI